MIPVGHFIRTWLRPTETFVWQPLAHHVRYRPVVLARDWLPSAPACAAEVHIASRALRGPARTWADLRYRAHRGLVGAERRYYTRTLRAAGCALVHAQFATDARYVLPAVRDAGLPFVVSVHGYDYSRFPQSYGGLGQRYLRPLFESGARFIAVAGAVRDALVDLGCPAERITVLSFGIDTEQFSPGPSSPASDGCTFLMVSGFTQKKGVPTAIRAFDRVRREVPGARLVLAGTGPERATAEALVRDRGLQEHVTFPGFVPQADLPALYRRCQVFVQPSETTAAGDKEGIPTVMMEAYGCGLPVIATTHAGIPELVTDGDNGYLVPERNVEALAARMQQLAERADLRHAFGEAGRHRILADYNVRTQTARLEALYDLCMGESGAAVGAAG